MTAKVRQLDTGALTAPKDSAAIRARAAELRGNGELPLLRKELAFHIRVLIGGGVAVMMWVIVLVAIVAEIGRAGWSLYITLCLGAAVGVGVWGLVVVGGMLHRILVTPERAWRLDRFARDNGGHYRAAVRGRAYPGILFAQGENRRASDLVTLPGALPVTYGNVQFEGQATRRWGFVAIRLPAPLPHMLLNARRSRVIRPDIIPAGIRSGQRLGLEGDFDRHFTLHCPAGYEQDALYLFTPEVMTRLIDEAGAFDVEIIDRWMLLYSRDAASGLGADRWRWIVSVGDTLAASAARWAAWRDDRLSAAAGAVPFHARPPGVAAPGRRLRTTSAWVGIGVGLAVILAGMILEGVWG